ncbi:MAG TPA: hypothetical protein VIM25_12700 [Candidatus Limnocylindrales bacterium]
MNRLRSLLGTLAWVAVIVVIALGAAGIVAAMDQPPGAAGRADVTETGDAEVTPMLDAAQGDLSALAGQVEALGVQARGALASLNGADPAISDAAIARGDTLVADVAARTTALRRELAAVPYVGTPSAGLIISDAVVARHAALVAALDATDGLDFSWARLSIGAVAATRMSVALAEHDRLVAQAADRGVHAKYAAALKLLDQASTQLALAHGVRDQLVNTVDVSVLDEWLKRNADYDVALRNLYVAISKVGKTVTAATRAAVKAEAAARARLPPDTRGLVIIMADIGRGGMTGAVIAIEDARAKLSAAIDAATPTPSGQPAASDAP